MTAAVTSFPHSKVAGQGTLLLPYPSGLFIYSSMRDCPSPSPQSSGHPALFAMRLLFFSCCLFIIQFDFFFLFPLGRGQSVQEAMLICPREYRMPILCSPGGLRLPSRLGLPQRFTLT
jgi:hypothetical protein